MKDKNDDFLGRWINNRLSDEELREFEASDEYDTYREILSETDKFKSNEVDEDEMYLKLKRKLASANTEPKRTKISSGIHYGNMV